MYYVADVDKDICSEKACSLCTTYCPESNCINYSEQDKSAYVSVDRCKACEICQVFEKRSFFMNVVKAFSYGYGQENSFHRENTKPLSS